MSTIGDIISSIPDLIISVVNILGNLLESVGDGFTSIFNKLGNVCTDIMQSITNVGKAIIDGFTDSLKILFVPSYNPASEVKDKLDSKFAFVSQLKSITSELFNDFDDDSDYPSFTITYKGTTYNIIDFSLYAPYRATVHSIIIAISWTYFVLWMVKYLPRLVKGGG